MPNFLIPTKKRSTAIDFGLFNILFLIKFRSLVAINKNAKAALKTNSNTAPAKSAAKEK
jgi:hypothetical protein